MSWRQRGWERVSVVNSGAAQSAGRRGAFPGLAVGGSSAQTPCKAQAQVGERLRVSSSDLELRLH